MRVACRVNLPQIPPGDRISRRKPGLVPQIMIGVVLGDDVSMQVVAVGFIISVVHDSFATALNSSSDVVYTYAVDQLGRARTP